MAGTLSAPLLEAGRRVLRLPDLERAVRRGRQAWVEKRERGEGVSLAGERMEVE